MTKDELVSNANIAKAEARIYNNHYLVQQYPKRK